LDLLNEDSSLMPFENYPVSLIGANKEPLKNFVMGVIILKEDTIWLLNGYPILILREKLMKL
jgi:hypothetical protein